MTKFTLLPWDSDFFGFRTGKLEVSEYNAPNIISCVDKALSEVTELIYLIVPDKIDRKEIFTESLVDQKVLFRKSLRDQDGDVSEIKEYTEMSVSPELYEIALESGKYSRFKTDSKLPSGSYEKLYRIWIEKSVSKEIADKVFVYKRNDLILGLITVKIKNTFGEIGLLGIHPDAQGKGIGSKLIYAAESYVISEGKSVMEVATQYGNSPACKFYKKNGYSVKSILNYYHIRKT